MNRQSNPCTVKIDDVGARGVTTTPDLGKLVAWLFGFAPVLLFALTWNDQLTDLQELARGYALPVVAVEILIIFISFREGVRLPRPRPTDLALLTGLGVLVWTSALTADSPATSLLRTAIWTIHFFFGLAIVNLWHREMLDYEQNARAIFYGFLTFFIMLVIFVATTEQSAVERFVGLPAFSHIRWFGY